MKSWNKLRRKLMKGGIILITFPCQEPECYLDWGLELFNVKWISRLAVPYHPLCGLHGPQDRQEFELRCRGGRVLQGCSKTTGEKWFFILVVNVVCWLICCVWLCYGSVELAWTFLPGITSGVMPEKGHS